MTTTPILPTLRAGGVLKCGGRSQRFFIVQQSRELSVDQTAAIDAARAIEAEVRKQDEALNRQMVEALEKSQPYTVAVSHKKFLQGWGAQLDRADAAITAAHVRLRSKP